MKLEFDSRLYPKKAVEAAAADFSEWARFEIAEKDGRLLVSAQPENSSKLDASFEAEFSNYVLGQIE